MLGAQHTSIGSFEEQIGNHLLRVRKRTYRRGRNREHSA